MCQGIAKFKVADKVSDYADKIKGIKIKEAIKCRIPHILIPISFLGNSFFFFQIMSLYVIRCNLPYLSFTSSESYF